MMKVQIVQMADDYNMVSSWVELQDLEAAMAVRGAQPTGQVGGDHLRECLRGKPKFTGFCGPMYGVTPEGEDAVRYEDAQSYDILSR